jgi:hypothetical protein
MFGKSECHRIHSLLWDYAGSQLSQADTQRVAQHLRHCTACRAWAEGDARTQEYLAAYRQQPVAPAPPAWLELRDAISVESAHHIASGLIPRQRHIKLLWATALFASAVLVYARHATRPPMKTEIVTKGQRDSRHELVNTIHPMVPNSPQLHDRQKHQPTYHQPDSRSIQLPLTPDLKSTLPVVTAYPHPSQGTRQAATGDDLHYLNAGSVDVLADWTAMPPDQLSALKTRIDRTVRRGDDFVQVTMPLLAAQGNGGVQAAAEAYQHEKEIVDARLAHKVTLAYKAAPLRDVCLFLNKMTGIDLKANQTVADEKVTLFCDDCPLRDVMRQMTHVFGFVWIRKGQDGDFAYELLQDVRSRIAEEELRNRDRNAIVIALTDAMERYRPYLDLKPEQLRDAARKASGDRAKLLWQMAGPAWGGIQCYFNLTGAQHDALFNDQEIKFSTNPASPGFVLPPDLNHMLLQASGVQISRSPNGSLAMGVLWHVQETGEMVPYEHGTRAEDWPGAYAMIGLQIKRPEAGRLELDGNIGVFVSSPDPNSGGGMATSYTLAEGVTPSAAGPENAKWNRALCNLPEFKQVISLMPEHTCPRPDQGVQTLTGGPPITDGFGTELPAQSHLVAADVWEAIHRQTGMPIIADAYTRLYPPAYLAQRNATVFDALCHDGDQMGIRWKKEGAFLQGRSITFYWDKLKEVPTRLLTHWQQDGAAKEGMPLQDVLEMAQLSDDQLDADAVDAGIRQCWRMQEWALMGHNSLIRTPARLTAQLTAQQLDTAQGDEGLALSELTPNRQEEWATFLIQQRHTPPQLLPELRLHIDYVPQGRYVWCPIVPNTLRYEDIAKLPLISDTTAAGALARAQQVYPGAGSEQIRRLGGVLAITLYRQTPTGRETVAEFGKPPICFLPTNALPPN